MVSVCRFHKHPVPQDRNNLARLKKKHIVDGGDLHYIGADNAYVTDGNERIPIDCFRQEARGNTVTLTQRESDLIALSNPGISPPKALEKLHPWLPEQKFFNNCYKNYSRLLELTERYDTHLFSANNFCNLYWNTVCNTLRVTSSLDVEFYSAWHAPIQEAYLLEETRPNRRVLAIDFIAMYAACMQHDFPDPKRLKRVPYGRYLENEDVLPTGLYRCRLGGTVSKFIRLHNPFRAFFCGRYLGVSIIEDIEVSLNEFEIDFYRKHFSRVFIAHGITSDRTIKHPLAREAQRSFARRQNYDSQENKVLADREKFRISLLSSCTNRPFRKTHIFNNVNDSLLFINNHFGIERFPGEPVTSIATWLMKNKHASLTIGDSGVSISAPSLHSRTACFSLSQRIVALGRVKVLEKMEEIFRLLPDSEICYCNIDSIHFSIPKSCLSDALHIVKNNGSQNMGDVKLESVTDFGLWIEPGRYWLYSSYLSKFKNIGVGHSANPFNSCRRYVGSRYINGQHIPIRAKITLAHSMSDSKYIACSESKVPRQWPIELSEKMTFGDVLSALQSNRRCAAPKKLAAFDRLRTKIDKAS